MAEVPVQIRATLYDLQSKSSRQVFLDGVAWRSDREIGGGPVVPPGGGSPPSIWDPVFPTPPIPIYPGGTPNPPGIWGPPDGRPTPPIYLPPEHVPPEMKPPEAPPPGSTAPVPPPSGSGGWPVQPITPPEYVVFNYPGVGPIYVTPPLTAQPK